VTQGRARNDVEQWVTSYKVSYSNDGQNFQFVDNSQVRFTNCHFVLFTRSFIPKRKLPR